MKCVAARIPATLGYPPPAIQHVNKRPGPPNGFGDAEAKGNDNNNEEGGGVATEQPNARTNASQSPGIRVWHATIHFRNKGSRLRSIPTPTTGRGHRSF